MKLFGITSRSFLSILLFLPSSQIFAGTIFFDDFEAGLGNFNVQGSPTPSIVSTTGPGGTPTNVFATNDDANFGGFGTTKSTFTYGTLGGTFGVTADVRHLNFGGNFQEKSGLTLVKGPTTPQDRILGVELFGNSSAFPSALRFFIETDQGFRENGQVNVANGDGWHNIGFQVNTDNTVSFLYNAATVFTTTGFLDTSFVTGSVTMGDRRSYYDNLTISATDAAPVPEPSVLSILGLGLVLLSVRRKSRSVIN